MNILAVLLVTAISMASVKAGVPPAGTTSQIQPLKPLQGTHPLFPRTPCLTVLKAANGSQVIMRDCTAASAQRAWTIVKGGSNNDAGPPGPIKIFNNFCLEVAGGKDVSGTRVQISTCNAKNPNQMWQWNWNATIQWAGHNKCLDLPEGDRTNDNKLQIWTCSHTKLNHNQMFSSEKLVNPLNQVAIANKPSNCIGVKGDNLVNGAPVYITSCSDAKSRKVFALPDPGHGNTGIYRVALGEDNTGPFKCIDVKDGKNAPGTKLQLWTCTANNKNQQFLPSGPSGTIRWAGADGKHPKCVDLTDGITKKGNQLQIWNCTGNANQIWKNIVPAQTAL